MATYSLSPRDAFLASHSALHETAVKEHLETRDALSQVLVPHVVAVRDNLHEVNFLHLSLMSNMDFPHLLLLMSSP